MAKKRRKDKKEEEEQYEFVPPEFNEKEFLKKEITDTRTFLLTIGYAILFAAMAAIVSSVDEGLIAPSFLIVLGGLVSLRYFYAIVNINTSKFGKKNWAGNIASFFLTFLAVWVLLLNFPFMDYADPSIENVVVWVDDGTEIVGIEYEYSKSQEAGVWKRLDGGSLAGLISVSESSTVNITAKVADTGGLVSVEIAIGYSTAPHQLMNFAGESRYEFKVDSGSLNSDSDLTFYIFAEDESGNRGMFSPINSFIPVDP